MKRYILILFCLGMVSSAFSQIVTDRPDQTEASITVSKKMIQVESGMSFESSVKTLNTLFGIGLSDGFEFRLNTNYLSPKDNGLSASFSDLELGTKIQLYRAKDTGTNIAFLSHVVVPTANETYTDNGVGFLNRVLVSHALSESFSIGYNLGYNKRYKQDGDFIYTLSFAKSFGNLGTYFEVYGNESESSSLFNFDFGGTYLLNPNLQLDISYGRGINNDIVDYFAAGISWRFTY